MDIEQAFTGFYEACRRLVEAFRQVAQAFYEALQRALSWFKQTVEDVVQSETEPPHKPPKLGYPQQSWAYYSKPQYRYKRAYRQEIAYARRRNI